MRTAVILLFLCSCSSSTDPSSNGGGGIHTCQDAEKADPLGPYSGDPCDEEGLSCQPPDMEVGCFETCVCHAGSFACPGCPDAHAD